MWNIVLQIENDRTFQSFTKRFECKTEPKLGLIKKYEETYTEEDKNWYATVVNVFYIPES